MRQKWQGIGAVVVVTLAVGFVLGRWGEMPRAEAQGAAAAGHVAVVIGQPIENIGYYPIVVVDSLEQTILVYEYMHSGRKIELEGARSYRYDKLLVEFQSGTPTVQQVRDQVEKMSR